MNLFNYEAWTDDEHIYNGRSKLEMINAIHKFVNSSTKTSEITVEQIRNLDEKALEKIGIQLHLAQW